MISHDDLFHVIIVLIYMNESVPLIFCNIFCEVNL